MENYTFWKNIWTTFIFDGLHLNVPIYQENCEFGAKIKISHKGDFYGKISLSGNFKGKFYLRLYMMFSFKCDKILRKL